MGKKNKQDKHSKRDKKDKTPEVPPVKPVDISGEATRALANKMREWSGWPKATLVWGKPSVSPHAETEHVTRTFTVDPNGLILNPHRVLYTVTPFRLRQEAVLTGIMLHEAAHARHTHWKPRTEEALAEFKHGDGAKVAPATFALASLMEEPRIEGLMAAEADTVGATGLAWTMRAMAAHLLPMTQVSADPSQALMQILDSWALRAGRQIGLQYHTGRPVPSWVHDFTSLLHQAVLTHLTEAGDTDPSTTASRVQAGLLNMIECNDDEGTTMIDLARTVLNLLFPETDPEDMPQAGGGCATPAPPEEGESQKGSGSAGTGDESDEQGSEGEQGEDEESGSQSGDSAGDSDNSDEEGDEEQEGKGGASPSTEDSESDTDEGDGEPTEQQKAQQAALKAMEVTANAAAENDAKSEAKQAQEAEVQHGAGAGPGGAGGGSWRTPSKDERQVQRNAERFLRDLIDGSEASKVSLSETPSATIDAAAHAAWKAGGQVRDPQFFLRTRREVQPTPPVKIAILVDVSQSMSQLQRPSALLSWALASAAVDLRNFAGRGVQIESTLIHWGDDARVMQRNGEMLPGIREVSCDEGTSAMDKALLLVEEQMPGFLDGDPDGKPSNRLLVQFTDWELSQYMGHTDRVTDVMGRALESGVNMVTVLPSGPVSRWSRYDEIMRKCRIQRGVTSVMHYDRSHPEHVWDHTAEVLNGKRPAPYAGF